MFTDQTISCEEASNKWVEKPVKLLDQDNPFFLLFLDEITQI